jgi:hypothetical protein
VNEIFLEAKLINGIILLGILVSVLGGPVIDGPQAEAFGVCDNVCEAGAILVLTEEISGRIYIRDLEDLLVVELKKPFGNRVEVGLEEGEYVVVNVRDGDVYESAIALCRGDFMELTPGMFLRDRGGDPPQENFYSQTQNRDTYHRWARHQDHADFRRTQCAHRRKYRADSESQFLYRCRRLFQSGA